MVPSQMTFEGNTWRLSSFEADILRVPSLTIFIKVLGWSGYTFDALVSCESTLGEEILLP
jgi:hypothetical protein